MFPIDGGISVSQTSPVLITFQQTFINHEFNLDAITGVLISDYNKETN